MATTIGNTPSSVTTTAPSRPATVASQPKVESGPKETFTPGEPAGPPKQSEVLALFAKNGEARSAASDLIRSEGVGAPDAEQRQRLMGELSGVDKDVLQLAADSGLKFAVADPGDNLVELGAVKPLDPEAIKADLPDMKAAGDNYLEASGPLASKMADLYNQRNAYIQEKGYTQEQLATVDDPKLRGIESQFLETRGQLMGEASKMLESGVRQFIPPQGEGMPRTTALESVAISQGAQTPEEIKEFTDMVKTLNADRLAGMGERGLAALQAQAQSGDAQQAEQAKAYLEAAERKGLTMINWQEEPLIIPDMQYHRDPDAPAGSPGLRLDTHDMNVLNEWGGGTTTVTPFNPDDPNGATGGVRLPKSNLVLLRSGVEGEGVHELGHAIEGIVEQKDPQFHQQWSSQVQQAFLNGQASGQGVTRYSLTNPDEYIAEGFSHFYEDPQLLKAKDPALFGLSEQLVARARELGAQ
ncbi:MAG: hypothetical protein AB7S38_27710 [Vulcanimicrobiota bacterium]